MCEYAYTHWLRTLISLTSESALVSQTRGFCERVTRDSYALIRLHETRIYAGVTCKDF